jgi:hypothetical protein
MVVPEYVRAASIAQVQLGQIGHWWKYVVRDPDMRVALDWRAIFNMFFDLFEASSLLITISINLSNMGIDGSSIFDSVDKDRLKRFLSENPYNKEVEALLRTVNARKLLTPQEVAACAAARVQSGVSKGDILSPKRGVDLRDHKERPFGNLSWTEFAEFCKTPIDLTKFQDSVRTSNENLTKATRHYVQRSVRRSMSDVNGEGGSLPVSDDLLEKLASGEASLKAPQKFLALFEYDLEMLDRCYSSQWLYPWHAIPDPLKPVNNLPQLTPAPAPTWIGGIKLAPGAPPAQTAREIQATIPLPAPTSAATPQPSVAPAITQATPAPSVTAPIQTSPTVTPAVSAVPTGIAENTTSEAKEKEKTKGKGKEKSKSKEKSKTKDKKVSKEKTKSKSTDKDKSKEKSKSKEKDT